MTTYTELPNLSVQSEEGLNLAYRDTGGDGRPVLLLLQHFRGNLDSWDPALVDDLATDRRVITYLLAGLLPEARLKIYPDSAHGFLFQHHHEFAADVSEFLNS